MDEPLLNVQDLEIIYQTDLEKVYAVNGITFSLHRGETLGIVGETGAGKTTTALSLLRVLPERTAKITKGELRFEGQDMLKITEHEMCQIRGEKIAMIFQDPMTSLNPVLTIDEQISEAIKIHNTSWDSEQVNNRVDEVLTLVGIAPSRKREYPHQFSGGMKQRVVIAIALACEPDLLIADEPTTALDVTIQAQVLRMIRELRDRLGTALIMITHDLGIVAQMCDKVAIMYAGEIIETGDAADIYAKGPHHPYTDGLFGSIPNLRQKMARLSPIPGLMPDPTRLPDGCNFYPRCPHRMEKCEHTNPSYYVSGQHMIRCHMYTDDA